MPDNERRIINGAIYEKTPNGIVLVGPAPAAEQPMRAMPSATVLPMNPVRAAREAQDRARQDEADARARRDQAAQEERDRRAALEWTATHNPDGTKKVDETPDKLANIPAAGATGIQENIATLRKIRDAIAALDPTKGRPESVGPGTGALGQTFTNWNDPQGTNTRAAISQVGAQKIHDLSGAAVSASEAPRFMPFVPTVTDPPEVALEKLKNFEKNLTQQIGEAANFYSPTNGYRPYTTPGLAEVIGGKPASETPDKSTIPYSDTAPPSASVVASGPTRRVRDDRASAMVDSLMNNGASLGIINETLRKQGQTPLDAGSYAAAKAWMAQNKGKRYTGADITKDEDMSLLQRVSGTGPAALVAHAGNAATAGLMGAVAGPKGQGALDAMAATSPGWSVSGELAGGALGAAGMEGAVAARAPAALARFAPRIADTLYGGISGFSGAREGEGVKGALLGAGAGLAGNIVGTGLVRGAGSAFRGVRDESAQYLRSRGIPLTIGQTVGNSGWLGAGIKKAEDAATSVPFAGNMVDARRREGMQGFNDVLFGDAAAPGTNITATGSEGLGQIRDGVQSTYRNALDPVTIDATDPAFVADVTAANAAANSIPNVGGAQDAATAALRNRIDGAIDPVTDQMTGRGFQEAYRGLARTGRERAAGDYGYEVGGAMREGQNALASALERQNPGAYDQFLQANAANRRMNVLATALRNAGNQADELVTPAQINRADIASTSRLDGQVASSAGNRPFYDLATAGQDVLPSKLPDSGTATRLAVGAGMTGALGLGGWGAGGAGGAADGAGAGLSLALLAALGGTRGVQALATRALLDRPQSAIRLGDILQAQARLGGTIGTGAAVSRADGY